MPSPQRNLGPRGPRFYQDGDTIWFVNVVDGSTRDGPMLATLAHREDFPAAYAAFVDGTKAVLNPPIVTFSGNEPAAEREEREERNHRTAQRRSAAAEA